ncbi:MAG: hypothetical protein HQK63_10865 [Desulfamplus sp.]|nr:hypothetical protein [Desulfamplus sp.]
MGERITLVDGTEVELAAGIGNDFVRLTYWMGEIKRKMEEGRRKIREREEENWYYIDEIDRMERETIDNITTLPAPMIDMMLSIMEMEVEALTGGEKGIEIDGKKFYLNDRKGIDKVISKINGKLAEKVY